MIIMILREWLKSLKNLYVRAKNSLTRSADVPLKNVVVNKVYSMEFGSNPKQRTRHVHGGSMNQKTRYIEHVICTLENFENIVSEDEWTRRLSRWKQKTAKAA